MPPNVTLNKNVIDALVDIRKDAARMMAVYNEMIDDKLKQIDFAGAHYIKCVSGHDTSVCISLIKHDDNGVEMRAEPNISNLPPGIVAYD